MQNLATNTAVAPLVVREKRLVLRVLGVWREARGEELLPFTDMLSPADMGEDADHVFMMDLLNAAGPRFTYVGEALRVGNWAPGSEALITDCPENSVLRLASQPWQEIVNRRVPITRGGPGVNGDVSVLYRSIMTPLVDRWDRISVIIGAANWRVVEAGETVPDA